MSAGVSRWRYVISGVLEVDVKPRLQMWSWQHIQQHRCMVKRYRDLYKLKITSRKPSEELLKDLEVGGPRPMVLGLIPPCFHMTNYGCP